MLIWRTLQSRAGSVWIRWPWSWDLQGVAFRSLVQGPVEKGLETRGFCLEKVWLRWPGWAKGRKWNRFLCTTCLCLGYVKLVTWISYSTALRLCRRRNLFLARRMDWRTYFEFVELSRSKRGTKVVSMVYTRAELHLRGAW